jgi:YegS/Rv2252/BmrU family lipid kinase
MEKGAIVIINRKSRYTESELQQGLELLEGRGIRIVKAITTSDPDEVTEAIEQNRGLINTIILGGGDGTINHAAGVVLQSGCPLGILPMGTANDLARTLGVPASVEAASGIIAEGHIRRIDVGRVNGRLFFNVAHIGLGAEVTHLISRDAKDKWGSLAYVKNLLPVFMKRRSFRTRIECNGERRDFRSIEVAVGNGRHYGGGLTISEDAEIVDGELHVYVVKPRSLWRMPFAIPAFRRGKAEREWIRYLNCRQMVVRTSPSLAVSVDGELVTRTPARFDVLEGAIPVFVPSNSNAGRMIGPAVKERENIEPRKHHLFPCPDPDDLRGSRRPDLQPGAGQGADRQPDGDAHRRQRGRRSAPGLGERGPFVFELPSPLHLLELRLLIFV